MNENQRRPRESYWQRGYYGREGPALADFATEYAYRIAREGWLNGREAAGLKWAGGFVERLADVDGAARQWREANPKIVVREPGKYVTGVDWKKANEELPTAAGLLQEGRRLEAKFVEVVSRGALTLTPVPMVLHCPACGLQHIDKPERDYGAPCKVCTSPPAARCYSWCTAWTNPPHRSHQCRAPDCRFEWRPADVPTVGVEAVATRGKNDGPLLRECQVAQGNGSCNCTGKCARGLSL